jgi:hypothetical protein
MARGFFRRIIGYLFITIVLTVVIPGSGDQTILQGNDGYSAVPLTDDPANTRIVRAYFPNKEAALKALHLFEVQCREVSYDEGYIVMEVTPEELNELKKLNFVLVPDPGYDVRHYRSADPDQKAGIPGFPCYSTVEEGHAIMDSICKALPQLATIVDIGDSWDKTQGTGGYDLKVLRLTNSAIPGPKPKLYINGSLHAREYATAQLVIRFAYYLISNYGKDPDVTWMLDYHEFHGQFFANPDGRKYAEKGQMWRKNTNKNYCASNANQRGADLNRNFEYNWAASSDQCGETFSGASAASEPETKAIQDYMKKIFTEKKQGIYIDLHAFAQTIMKSNVPELNVLARKFSFFNKYSHYEERGMTYEYAYQVVGIAGFLIELGTAFFEKCDFFEMDLIPKHIPLFTYALRAAREPFSMPAGPDALKLSITNKKLQATITDTLYNGAGVTMHTIASAEYYINTPPWIAGATPLAMQPTDGKFDQKTEVVEATLTDDRLSKGNGTIFLRGKDSGGFWGPVFSIFYGTTGINSVMTRPVNLLVTYNAASRPSQAITYSLRLPEQMQVTLVIYSLDGRIVATVAHTTMAAGSHRISWNRTNDHGALLPAGVYLAQLSVNEFRQVNKTIMIR